MNLTSDLTDRLHLLNRRDQAALERLLRQFEGGDAWAGGGRRLLCAACRHPVTASAHAIEVHGSHTHDFANPAGVAFHIGCFAAAPGCRGFGEPTAAYTWFRGYRWRYALCGGCGTHLGWRFSGVRPFFGLILARLADEGDQ